MLLWPQQVHHKTGNIVEKRKIENARTHLYIMLCICIEAVKGSTRLVSGSGGPRWRLNSRPPPSGFHWAFIGATVGP
jgi:hypothetical protein